MIVGSGVDVIEIARIERAMVRSERFEQRVFADAESAACRTFARAGPHFAIRFAVKEAVMKALGTGWTHGVRWVDIETLAAESGPGAGLSVRLHGRVGDLANELGARRFHVAVSRTRSHAIAVVVLEWEPA